MALATVLGARVGEPAFLIECFAAAGEESSAGAVGQEAVVADADEALGEDVEQETPDELGKGKRQSSRSTAAVVLEAEGDGSVVDVQQAVVRDGDAVGVAGEVLQDVLGVLEGGLGVDDPLGATGLAQELLEGLRVPVASESSMELQAAVSECGAEARHELAPEEAAEDAHGQEEARPAGLPGVSVVGQAASGDDTVHMGMMDEGLTPGVEDDEEAEACAEVARVGGDLLEGPGDRVEQEVVDDLRALEGERCEGPEAA